MDDGLKKLLLAVGGPILGVGLVVLGVYTWDRGALPFMRPAAVEVTPLTINRDHRGVRIAGTAHQEARLTQKVEGQPDRYLVPLFPQGDTAGREIRVLWRTHRPLEDMVSFEDVMVEGFARPPGQLVPVSAKNALEQKGYVLDEKFVLVEEWED